MNEKEVKDLAGKCLHCKNSPCTKTCPMGTNIPLVLDNVKHGNFNEAYKILINNNILSHICSIICPTEKLCKGACLRGKKDEPVNFSIIEKFLNEYGEAKGLEPDICNKSYNIKVAVIGSGPSSISFAYNLVKNGFKVDIYDKELSFGGLLDYGIPNFRLEKVYVENVINTLTKLGVNFIPGKELGKDISILKLKEIYNYIFIGIGASIPITYSLTNYPVKNIFTSDEILRSYNNRCSSYNLGNTIIIGGGNVAVDVSRASLRMGAKTSSIFYRRNRSLMPANKDDLELAESEGVKFKEYLRVESVNLDKKLNIKSVNCIETKIKDGKTVDTLNHHIYKADTVIFAIGYRQDKDLLLKEGLTFNEDDKIIVDENYETQIPNVYCGGDLVNNKSTACYAAYIGEKASNAILNKVLKKE